jgi:uncharacterized protein YdeI (YjbR/CyaY-like superfamily)
MNDTQTIIERYAAKLAEARQAQKNLRRHGQSDGMMIRRELFHALRNALEDARTEYKKLSPIQRLSVEEPPWDVYGANWE